MKSPLVFPRWSYLNFLDKYYQTFPPANSVPQVNNFIQDGFLGRLERYSLWSSSVQTLKWREEGRPRADFGFPTFGLLETLTRKSRSGALAVLINNVLIAGPGDTHRNNYRLIILFILIPDPRSQIYLMDNESFAEVCLGRGIKQLIYRNTIGEPQAKSRDLIHNSWIIRLKTDCTLYDKISFFIQSSRRIGLCLYEVWNFIVAILLTFSRS